MKTNFLLLSFLVIVVGKKLLVILISTYGADWFGYRKERCHSDKAANQDRHEDTYINIFYFVFSSS
jgi:hypothetical protein